MRAKVAVIATVYKWCIYIHTHCCWDGNSSYLYGIYLKVLHVFKLVTIRCVQRRTLEHNFPTSRMIVSARKVVHGPLRRQKLKSKGCHAPILHHSEFNLFLEMKVLLRCRNPSCFPLWRKRRRSVEHWITTVSGKTKQGLQFLWARARIRI